MGKPVYLGKVKLGWCDRCNVPLLGERCSRCGAKARKVEITPPGETRIGFEGDMEILNTSLERQFGCRIERELVLFNRVPHRDRMDEVIVDGYVIGNLRYDPDYGFKFTLRLMGAYLLNECANKGWVIADRGAVKPLLSGKNLMAPGVLEMSREIKRGDEVIIRDPDGRAFAVGIAKMGYEDIMKEKKGMAVKVRYAGYGEFPKGKDARIEDAIEANREHLERLEREAVEFIHNIRKRNNLPMAVSFSGGKDSLATLLLAMESGENFDIFFLDTGIEFPETVNYVDEIERRYGVKIERINAGNAFWESLEVFGPPGRDYRWCCKVCKLGPTTRFILEKYGDGLLTLVGQRRYESEERMRKGRIWKNEWVPNQLSASPIQNWTSLEVWFYILWKNAPVNPWYRRGLTRIGCYLCPSSDLADFEIVRKYFPKIEEWFSYLKEYAKSHGVLEDWTRSAWRWRRPPKWAGEWRVEREKPRVNFEGEGWKRVNIEGKGMRGYVERISNLLTALPQGTWSEENGEIWVSPDVLRESKSLILRALGCVGCGVCLGRCPTNALYLDDDGKIRIIEEKCIQCLDCLGPCPAEMF